MARTKTWTAGDLTAARTWVERKAATPIFRDADTVSLEQVRAASDTDLPAVLQEVLTAEGWSALLNALRQRAHQARRQDESSMTEELPQAVQMALSDNARYRSAGLAMLALGGDPDSPEFEDEIPEHDPEVIAQLAGHLLKNSVVAQTIAAQWALTDEGQTALAFVQQQRAHRARPA